MTFVDVTVPVTVPVSVRVRRPDGGERWIGWYIDARIASAAEVDAPVVVEEAARRIRANAFGLQLVDVPAKSYRAHARGLLEQLQAGGKRVSLADLHVSPLEAGMRESQAIKRRHFVRHPLRGDVEQKGDGNWWVDVQVVSDPDEPECAMASMVARGKLEKLVVLDGIVWSRSVGPEIHVETSWGGETRIETAGPRPGSTREDVVPFQTFSALDRDVVMEGYARRYPHVVDASAPIRILSEHGWDGRAASAAVASRALLAQAQHMLMAIEGRWFGRLSIAQVRAYEGLRSSVEDRAAHETVLEHISELLSLVPSATEPAWVGQWAAALSVQQLLGSRYDEIVGFAL